MQNLKDRWGIQSNFQLTIIFIVFAVTGSSSAYFSKALCLWLGITQESIGGWFSLVRLLLIFPLYQILLIFIGFLSGQFRFFWAFEKKILRCMGLGFLLKKKNTE